MGLNQNGRLGNGNTINQYTPIKSVDENVTLSSVGSAHSLFIKNDGSLWTMGHNNKGQLGDGTTTSDPLP